MRYFKFVFGATLFLLAVSLPVSPARAQDAAPTPAPSAPSKFFANVSTTTGYHFRGLTQTDHAPALQGGFDFETVLGKTSSSLYLGLWGSNVDFNEATGVDGATLELDWYGGLKGSLGGSSVGWNVGFIYYSYPGADPDLSYNFLEFQTALNRDFGAASIAASVNYSANNFAGSGRGIYPKVALGVPVPALKGLSFSGYLAKQFVEKEAAYGVPDYLEWNVSATYKLSGFDLSLGYFDTDVRSGDGSVLWTARRSF